MTGQTDSANGSSRNLDFTLHLAEIRDLFVAPAPQPFASHTNYESGVDQIFNLLRQRKPRQPLRATIHVESELSDSAVDDTEAALRRYCDYKIETQHVIVSCFRREGAAKLAIGLAVLVTTLGLKAILDRYAFDPALLHRFLAEGLTVLGWVMVWAPASLLLLDWWPAQRNIDAYEAIRKMEITLIGQTMDVHPQAQI